MILFNGWDSMREERFKNIDFLRFLGVIIIAYFHMISCGLSNFTECSPIINNIKVNASWGFFWVEFFFILSGFFLFKYTNFNIKFLKYSPVPFENLNVRASLISFSTSKHLELFIFHKISF